MSGPEFLTRKGEGIKLLELPNEGQKILKLYESDIKAEDSIEK